MDDRRRLWWERAWSLVNTLAILYALFVVAPAQTRSITVNRTSTTGALCQFVNDTREGLRVLIVDSTAASKHIHYPGPPYSDRVTQATLYADKLRNGDCEQLQELVASRAKFKRVPLLTLDRRELAPLYAP